ncbi:MAG: hypothetical protein M3Y28_05095 [Armatimonadota bacterium]|nr:hypothetical protein [Armatimonadota bacterium]
MSRSRKKHPFHGITTADSEKQDKRAYNRRFRHVFHQAIQADPTRDLWPHLREHSDPWGMDKDGKIRFDPANHPKLMRK